MEQAGIGRLSERPEQEQVVELVRRTELLIAQLATDIVDDDAELILSGLYRTPPSNGPFAYQYVAAVIHIPLEEGPKWSAVRLWDGYGSSDNQPLLELVIDEGDTLTVYTGLNETRTGQDPASAEETIRKASHFLEWAEQALSNPKKVRISES